MLFPPNSPGLQRPGSAFRLSPSPAPSCPCAGLRYPKLARAGGRTWSLQPPFPPLYLLSVLSRHVLLSYSGKSLSFNGKYSPPKCGSSVGSILLARLSPTTPGCDPWVHSYVASERLPGVPQAGCLPEPLSPAPKLAFLVPAQPASQPCPCPSHTQPCSVLHLLTPIRSTPPPGHGRKWKLDP